MAAKTLRVMLAPVAWVSCPEHQLVECRRNSFERSIFKGQVALYPARDIVACSCIAATRCVLQSLQPLPCDI